MRIKNYIPSKKSGNTIGFLSIEIDTIIDEMTIPEALEVTILRNSNNGHLFVSWPSRPYKAVDGTTRYAPQVKWPKEKYDIVQNAIIKRFQEFIDKNQPSIQKEASLAQSQHPQYSQPIINDNLPF